MRVAVHRSRGIGYPETAPFHPGRLYPEAPFPDTQPEPNRVYDSVRELLHLQNLDPNNFGTDKWNPLGSLINPGMTVLIKPNLIKENHPRDPEGWRYMMTHGSVIRAVCDYAAIALCGRGRIVLADAPQTDSSFDKITRVLQLDKLRNYYNSVGLGFELRDLRKFEWESRDDVIVSRRNLAGDPEGYIRFDLGERSLFYNHSGEGRYYGADYDTSEISEHHRGDTHEYVISGTAIKCDVFINLPKMKTHKKAGVTLSLKNLVGINGDKNYLPHYTEGTPDSGGDQFPSDSLKRSLEGGGLKILRKIALSLPLVGPAIYRNAKKIGQGALGKTSSVVRSGNWYGNDTTWRMCLDLNRILLYGNPDSSFREDSPDNRKKYLTIVDGIVAGDGDGPIDVDPLEADTLIMGTDPVCVDAVCALLMGFDYRQLPVIRGGFELDSLKITDADHDEIKIISNIPEWNGAVSDINHSTLMHFRPHFGWRDKIELVGPQRDESVEKVG